MVLTRGRTIGYDTQKVINYPKVCFRHPVAA
jgi:hypothetical protein